MLNHAPFLYISEIESVATLCFRAFEGSNYEVRCSVAKLLGTLAAMTQIPSSKSQKPLSTLFLIILQFLFFNFPTTNLNFFRFSSKKRQANFIGRSFKYIDVWIFERRS